MINWTSSKWKFSFLWKIMLREVKASHRLGANSCKTSNKDLYPGYIRNSHISIIRRQKTQLKKWRKYLKNIILQIVTKSRFIVPWGGCGWRDGIREYIKKFWKMIEIFVILIVVTDSQMYIYIKTRHTFNMYSLL